MAERKAGKGSILCLKPVPPTMINYLGSRGRNPKGTRVHIWTWTRRGRRLLRESFVATIQGHTERCNGVVIFSSQRGDTKLTTSVSVAQSNPGHLLDTCNVKGYKIRCIVDFNVSMDIQIDELHPDQEYVTNHMC